MTDTDRTDPAAPASTRLADQQKADIARLLGKFATRDTVTWIGTAVLGETEMGKAANAISNSADYAQAVVALLADAGRLGEAVGILRRESLPNLPLLHHLEYVLGGGSLDDTDALQKFMNEYQPVFRSGEFGDWYELMKRTVCAIGVCTPRLELRGTGFLVGPDLVMTNHHVLMDQVRKLNSGKFEANPGSQIFAFFDYLAEPEPYFPLPQVNLHGWSAVAAANPWLVHARPLMPHDGTKKAPKKTCGGQLDYLVIRLSKPVGSLPFRYGGGAPRGWLELPEEIDVVSRSRLFVFQHPAKLPQVFDFGDFVELDPTRSRCRYKVSTARGSSGGATVNEEGKLFALHNAEVQDSVDPMNQGVRIDLIAQDLKAQEISDWPPASDAAAQGASLRYWSLTDSLSDPRPVIGRKRFREEVARQAKLGATARPIVVSGPDGSGRRFSEKLLRRIVGPEVPIAVLREDDLCMPAQELIAGIANHLALPDPHSVPEPRIGEDKPRWLRSDLPVWLQGNLQLARENIPLPKWVVVEAVLPEGQFLRWGDGVKDLLAALLGVRDQAHPPVPLPDLRWLLIGRETIFPLTGLDIFRDDLTATNDLPLEFAECMGLAWWSIHKDEQSSPKLLAAMMPRLVGDAKPVVKAAAEFIRDTIQIEVGTAGGH